MAFMHVKSRRYSYHARTSNFKKNQLTSPLGDEGVEVHEALDDECGGVEARLLLVELNHDDAPEGLVAEAALAARQHGVVPLAAEDRGELLALDRQVGLQVQLLRLVLLVLVIEGGEGYIIVITTNVTLLNLA